jgi:hypothetical protein
MCTEHRSSNLSDEEGRSMIKTQTIEIGREGSRGVVTPGWRDESPTCERIRQPLLSVDLRRNCGARSLDEAQRRAQFEAPPEAGPDYWLG